MPYFKTVPSKIVIDTSPHSGLYPALETFSIFFNLKVKKSYPFTVLLCTFPTISGTEYFGMFICELPACRASEVAQW